MVALCVGIDTAIAATRHAAGCLTTGRFGLDGLEASLRVLAEEETQTHALVRPLCDAERRL